MTAQALPTRSEVDRPTLRMRLARLGSEPALFSVKCFAAAMLAYYVALRIGLTRPYWAITTSYIVAQPLAGAVLSKAVFRVAGTALGATAAVVLVPTFVNEPAALSLGLALWLGVCLYFSLLDRTPRAYIFLLAGYTASIIGFPSVEVPGQIFNVAILRVQEIVIGILCGSLIHGVILPRSVADQLLRRADTILADAERWTADSLSGEGGAALARDRRRLALDVNELHQLSIHLPFDTGRLRPRVRTVRALQDELSFILPLASGVEDRLRELIRVCGAIPADLKELLARIQAWLAAGADEQGGNHLVALAAAAEPDIVAPLQWRDALRLSITARLGELVQAHRDARLLREQIRAPTARAVSPSIATLLAATGRRALHRDRGVAIRAAAGTTATVLLGCAFWILTGWPDGAGAVLIAGVCCALFGSSDEPAPAIMKFFWGSLLGIGLAALYAYAILPRVTTFPMLILALAPTMLILGAFLADARPSFVGLGAVLGVLNSIGLNDRYTPGFEGFINGSLAQLMGTLFAVVTVGLFQTIGTARSAERLIRAGWRDLARRSDLRSPPDATGWTSRMLDRIGLLAPRLAARGDDPGKPLLDALVDLRIGLTVGELRNLRRGGTEEEEALITPVLRGIAKYYRGLRIDAPAEPSSQLLECIDNALRVLAQGPSAERRRAAVLALTSLRRNLFPRAAGLNEETAG
ncbi:FUSC family protein [Sphingomonas sp.]|uniref:FUSC family protein n=1 Tax=Sphingomonas sp. TaxID=28214 RepID=UPI003B3BC971